MMVKKKVTILKIVNLIISKKKILTLYNKKVSLIKMNYKIYFYIWTKYKYIHYQIVFVP
jgi:hypothetical protein